MSYSIRFVGVAQLLPPRKNWAAGGSGLILLHTDYPKIQILTIADLLKGAKVQMPIQYGTFKQAKRVREVAGEQPELELLA